MLKITLVATLFAGSASLAFAQLDGDGNGIPAGQSGVFARQMPGDAYASQKPTRRTIERDGDANGIPGSVD
jgi:hypothetical protein